jgi:hypothetical protein
MRRQFQLPEEDEEGLAARGLNWESVIENQGNQNAKFLIFPQYRIPQGYNHGIVGVALRIPPAYPDEQIDMVYFQPALALANGKTILNLSPLLIDGKQYQQWSRHRTPANPWRNGLDNICTHLLQVDSWLERELRK